MKKSTVLLLTLLLFTLSANSQTFNDSLHFRTLYSGADYKYDFDKYDKNQFREWQSEFRSSLKEAIGLTTMEMQYPLYMPKAELREVIDKGSYTFERWILMTEPTVPLPIVVLRPKNIPAEGAPLVIAVHGHSKNPELFAGQYQDEVEREMGEAGERNVGEQAVKEGYIAIVPTTRGFGETMLKRDKAAGKLNYSDASVSHNNLLVGRTLAGERVWDVSRIIDWAYESLPVDRTNLIVTGNSGGGTVTVYAGALDPRITISMPCSAFCPFVESIGMIQHCDCNYNPGILNLGNMQDIAGLTAPRLFHAIHGVKDHIFPIEATRVGMEELSRIYWAAGAKDNCSLYEGSEGHRYYKDGAWPFVREHLEKPEKGCVVTAPETPFDFEPLRMHIFPEKEFSIVRYGAKKGNVKATTEAFKKAFAACNKAGGGKVVVPDGEWLTGPIHFKSNCELHLSDDAVLVFTDDTLYFPKVRTSWEGQECMNFSPLVYGIDCENIAVTGRGTLTPVMELWESWYGRPESHLQATRRLYSMASTGVPVKDRKMYEGGARMRPNFVEFINCTNVQLSDFKIRESPMWCIHLLLCKDVWAHDLDIRAEGHNSDGLDIDMTSHAVIECCRFHQADDAVVFKAGRNQDAWRLGVPTEKVVVRNCVVEKGNSIFAAGSELSAGIRDVHVHNCTSDETSYVFLVKTNERRGGFVKDITVEDCRADSCECVFSCETDVMFQYRTLVPTYEVRLTDISGLSLRNCRVNWSQCGVQIKGDSRKPVRDIEIKNVVVGQVSTSMSTVENAEDLNVEGFNVLKYSRTGERKPMLYDGKYDVPNPLDIGKKLSALFLTTDPECYDPAGYSDQDMKAYNGHYGRGEYVHYSVVSYWVNCLEFARMSGDKELEKKLIAKFEPFLSEKKNILNRKDHVDYAVFGAVPLEIYLLNGDERYLKLGLEYADAQWSKPDSNAMTESGNRPYEEQMRNWGDGYTPQTRLWIDDMYMINLLQTQAYRATGDPKYIERAAREMVLYLEKLQEPDGLFYHAEGKHFIWGRGDGWMAAGMPMILKYLPKSDPSYDKIFSGYRRMMTALLKNQRKDGLWGQLVDDPEIWSETSCSAMFAYGFSEGVRYGWLDPGIYGPAVEKAWKALCKRLDPKGLLQGVCVGTGARTERQWYYDRPRINGDPHGQAPMMWICNSMFPVAYLIGDSTCSDYQIQTRPRYGWGEKLQQYLKNVRVENHASPGRSTKSFIDEGRWDVVMSRLKPGDYVFIQFGHNDEKLFDPKRGTEPFKEFYDNLCKFVSDARSKGAKPILLTPVCRRKFGEDGAVTFTHLDYPKAIRKAGSITDTPVLDIELRSAEWLEQLGPVKSAEFFMFSIDGKDNTHFNAAGAAAVADMVAAELKKTKFSNITAK